MVFCSKLLQLIEIYSIFAVFYNGSTLLLESKRVSNQ